MRKRLQLDKMHMWFWFGNKLGDFLLPGYNVSTTASLFCTCLALFSLTILYEGMKVLQIKLQQSTVMLIQKKRPGASENSCLLSKISSKSFGREISLQCIRSSSWSFQVFHWFIHNCLGYILMLSVMTYNVYINIAIALGAGFGYWIFGPKLIELNMRWFYERQRLLDCDKECTDNIVNHESQGSTVSVLTERLMTEATVEVHMPVEA